jgi:hypothetical protein
MAMRLALTVCAIVLGVAPCASGQAAPAQAAEPVEWSFSAATYVYFVPDDSNYAQPTFTADRGALHLEARYNYEDLETGSVWAGYNFSGGEKVAWEFTPMFGGVFGTTAGVAPAYKGSLSWWKLEFASEGEYVIDVEDSSASFFYNWSELTIAPAGWWRIGVVTQRTRVYATERDLQRGLVVGFGHKNVDAAIYVFNPDDSKPVVTVAVTVGF